MARLLGPDPSSRLITQVVGTRVYEFSGRVAVVYLNEGGTQLADIAAYNPAAPGTPGASLPGSKVLLDGNSRLPKFFFPDGVDTLYVAVNGMQGTAMVTADVDARLDAGGNARRPAPVCGEFGTDSSSPTSGGGHLGVNTMIKKTLPPNVGLDLWSLRFTNTKTVFQAGEAINTNAVAYKVSVSLSPTGPWCPFSTRGSLVGNMDGGAYIDTDPIHFSVPAGGTFYLKVYAAVPSGVWPIHNPAGAKGTTYWVSSGAGETDLTTSTAAFTATTSNYPYAPVALIDQMAPTSRLSVFIAGDSIASGIKDNFNGFLLRAFGGAVCYQRSSTSGVSLQHYAEPSTGYRRMTLGRECNVAVEMLGTNDLNNGRSLAQLQADKLALWTQLRQNGRRPVFTCTITPWTNSTDWTTVGGQTVKSWESVRVALNDWIRSGAPIDPATKAAVAVGTAGALVRGNAGHPLHDYFDVADTVETARNSGLWKLDPGTGNRVTDDGVHPLDLGNILMAQAIDINRLTAAVTA